jgi:hypothetical protein
MNPRSRIDSPRRPLQLALILASAGGVTCASHLPRPPTAAGQPRDASAGAVAPRPPPLSRPSVLFASPSGAATLDLDYLRELHAAGFEIDYTKSLDELTTARMRGFNAVVLSPCEASPRRPSESRPSGS